MLNLRRNLRNSLAGLRVALSDKSFRAQLVLGVVFIPLILTSAKADYVTKLAAVGTYAVLIGFELINTAIERLCDRVTKAHDELIRDVKDMASGAVFIILLLFIFQCTWILVWNP